jgi:TonB family protein
MRDVGKVKPVRARRGEEGEPISSRRAKRTTQRHERAFDAGEETGDLMSRAIASKGHVPVFQSDELIIERLVRPIYPDEVRDRGVEGRVAVLALVDTSGTVVDAEVVTASGEPQLDHAAEAAARQCRFRPYRVHGEAREVYAMFRYNFHLVE